MGEVEIERLSLVDGSSQTLPRKGAMLSVYRLAEAI